MKRILVILFNFMSMSAIAGYECDLKLAHNDDLRLDVATKIISIAQSLKSGSDHLFVESEKKKKKFSLEVRSVMDGYEYSESASFVVMRRTTKRGKSTLEKVSELVTLGGNDSQRLWFEDYKLDINCKIWKK